MSICPCNCKYHRSIDIKTPRMVPLSAFFKRSFAFHSVRERFPLVIKRIMEDLMKRRDELAKKYGEPVREELKKTVDELAALKYELQSNKELTPILSNDADAAVFNDYLQRKKAEDGHTSPYSTSILYAEAYLYRRLRTIFEKKKILKDYDCFKKFKEDAFEDAIPIMRELAIHMEEGCECISDKDAIFDLMKIALWANKYDLSINKGVEHGIHLNMARKLEPNVVCDHSEAIWEAFRSNRDNDSIAYVLNNAGYELFCDLCLADMLTTKGLTSHVTFHTKTIPSYVSDVTNNDINWMIETLKAHVDPHLRCLGQRWNDYLSSKIWEIEDDPFWHYPLDYTYMQEYAPALHDKLASVNLIIFKGDLAYRKLFGDINWDPNTPVDQGLRGFLPAKLCVLRTIKYGVVCGIADDVAEKCMKADLNWKESGNYGVIQYCDTIYVEPPQEEMVFPPDPGAENADWQETPREAPEEIGSIDEDGPQPEVEGGGDLGLAEESGRGRETARTDDVAGVVAGLVSRTAETVDNEDREGNVPDSTSHRTSFQTGQTTDAVKNAAEKKHYSVQFDNDKADEGQYGANQQPATGMDHQAVEAESTKTSKGLLESAQPVADRRSDRQRSELEDESVVKDQDNDNNQEDVKYDEEPGVDDDRGPHDNFKSDIISSVGKSNEQDTQDIPKGHKKYQPPKNEKWDRYLNRLRAFRKAKASSKDDKDSKVVAENEGKAINPPVVTTARETNVEPNTTAPTEKNPDKKNNKRVPETPSEVSVNHTPEVDGEEAPE